MPTIGDVFNADDFNTEVCNEDDTLFAVKLSDGSRITVLDRLTGWGGGLRDVETGYRGPEKQFWLASCDFDIREVASGITYAQAIEMIKNNANTCVPS
jgi:hypothetical protein